MRERAEKGMIGCFNVFLLAGFQNYINVERLKYVEWYCKIIMQIRYVLKSNADTVYDEIFKILSCDPDFVQRWLYDFTFNFKRSSSRCLSFCCISICSVCNSTIVTAK